MTCLFVCITCKCTVGAIRSVPGLYALIIMFGSGFGYCFAA